MPDFFLNPAQRAPLPYCGVKGDVITWQMRGGGWMKCATERRSQSKPRIPWPAQRRAGALQAPMGLVCDW